MNRKNRWVALAAVAALLPLGAQSEVVKLAGATTVVNVVVNPHRAEVEKATGHTLEINGNATGRGMVDLSDGKADAAMVSEPMDIAIAAAEVAGKKLDAAKFKLHEIRKVADLVPNDEAAIGGLGRGFVKAGSKAHIVETGKIERPLAIVTVGEPQPKVRQVIDAFRTAAR